MRATRRPRSCNEREVSRRLRADQLAEPERLVRDRDLVTGVVDDLQEEPGRRAALVQLPGRVQVARPEAVGDDAARRLPRSLRERGEFRLGLRRRVDERLDADVVAGLRLREQLLGRPDGLD